jgi:hypothetical protein
MYVRQRGIRGAFEALVMVLGTAHEDGLSSAAFTTPPNDRSADGSIQPATKGRVSD